MNPLHLFRFDRRVANRTIDTLTVFLAADDLEQDELEGSVEKEIDERLVPEEVVLIVREKQADAVTAALVSGTGLTMTRQRIGTRTIVTVVGFDHQGGEASRRDVLGEGPASDLTLTEYFRRAATAIFLERRGFVEANESFHFRNPSGRHTNRFMRLANLLVRQSEISLIAATLLPHIPDDATKAYVDTPALFAVVASMNDHLRSLQPHRAPLSCDSFKSYGGVDAFEFRRGENAVVLISASSSGGMAAKIVEAGVDGDRIATVLYLGPANAKLRIGVDLGHDGIRNPQGIDAGRRTYEQDKCELCDAGSTWVQLQGDQFDLGGPRFDPIVLKRTDAPEKLASSMSRLAGHGILTVSLSQAAAAKQYSVDAAPLLEEPEFVERLTYFSRRHVPSGVAECIVADAHSTRMAKLVFDGAAPGPRFVDREAVAKLTPEDRGDGGEPLDGRPLVIVCAVIESGRVLLDISRDLRRSRSASPQIYLVGLAKSAGSRQRDQLATTLQQTARATPHQFATVEDLVLPPGSGANAWVRERIMLEAAKSRGMKLSDILEKRLESLRKSSDPRVDDLFVSHLSGAMRVQPGFVYWPEELTREDAHKEADVFYTISSILQRLRSAAPGPGARVIRTNWFQQTLIDPSNFGRFNDGAIQAALLRSARPAEMDYASDNGSPQTQHEAARIFSRIVSGAPGPRGDAAAEVLIALGTRRITLRAEDLGPLLTRNPEMPAVVAELLEICRALLL